jgi:lipoyl(octanoyl) transferase
VKTLEIYLFNRLRFDDLLLWQKRTVYEISGSRERAVLLMCEHEPLITVGREGSRADIRFDGDELRLRNWPVRWVNRGGGCLLHLPGQLAIYPILPLDRLGLDLPTYLDELRQVICDVVSDANVRAAERHPSGVMVSGRLIAQVGVAVRNWVSYFGAALNINPDLEPFRRIDCGIAANPMTSIERERRATINPHLVRQQVVDRMQERFRFERVIVRHQQPSLPSSPVWSRRDLAPVQDIRDFYSSIWGTPE